MHPFLTRGKVIVTLDDTLTLQEKVMKHRRLRAHLTFNWSLFIGLIIATIALVLVEYSKASKQTVTPSEHAGSLH